MKPPGDTSHRYSGPVSTRTAAIVIGRNEGDRVVRAVKRALDQVEIVIYVDSASSDGSPERVAALGVEVIAMGPDQLGAARAREQGFQRLLDRDSGAAFVQFLDGDCLLEPGWIAAAEEAMDADEQVGAVVGRRLEEHRDASFWIRICDADWVLPPGTTDSLGGGDALVRIATVEKSGGWPSQLAAGEDLVFSQRIRDAGWTILRLDRLMVSHDIAIHGFGQYWTRAKRAGLAYAAAAAAAHGGPNGRWTRRTIGMLFYGLVLPAVALVGAVLLFPFGLLFLALLLVLPLRHFVSRRRAGDGVGVASAHAGLIFASKFAGAVGVVQWAFRGGPRSKVRLIEYKPLPASPDEGPA